MAGEDDQPSTRRADPDEHYSANKIPVGEALAGKYRVDAILGTGGMGTVLRARHIHLDRDVAIKVMHSELVTNEDSARRFALEGRATAALKSNHTVRILDIDRLANGVPFMVMELLEGTDLATLVAQEGPLPVDRAIQYMLQVADAIAEAHANGIIHRDLKPHNMMLTTDGIIKVFDFGLAKALQPDDAAPESGLTSTKTLVGSPIYMSPEQARMLRVDERTDIWALGATFYHLLSGRPPFFAPNLQLLTSLIVSKQQPRIADHRDDVSPTVDAVIAKCMRKNPNERYATVAGFQGALLHLRVELQTGALGATHPGGDTSVVGSTLPTTTRRMSTEPRADSATDPMGDSPAHDDGPTIVNPPGGAHMSDEPTQISSPGVSPRKP